MRLRVCADCGEQLGGVHPCIVFQHEGADHAVAQRRLLIAYVVSGQLRDGDSVVAHVGRLASAPFKAGARGEHLHEPALEIVEIVSVSVQSLCLAHGGGE